MPAWIAAGGSLLGGLLGGRSARKAADTAAQGQIEAAKIAADAAKFRPYSITSGFGRGFFDEEKQTAGYELDPQLQAFRDRMYGGAGDVFGQLELDPTKAAQQYYTQQQELMAPQRQAEDIALRQQQLQSGRIGLGLSGAAMGAGAGTGYVNPEQYQRDLARAQADAAMGFQSREMAQADIDRLIGRGTGMMQTGFGIEELGMKPMMLGADIGNRAAVAGGNQAAALMAGGQGAANARLAGGLSQAGMWQSLGKTIGNQDWSGVYNPSSMFAPSVTDGGYSAGVGAAYGGTYNDLGQFTPNRKGF